MNEFNRSFFNRTQTATVIEAVYDMAASMNGRFALGAKVFYEEQYDSAMTASASLGFGYHESYLFESEMDGAALALPVYAQRATFESEISADMEAELTLWPSWTVSGWITARAGASKRISPKFAMRGQTTARFRVRSYYTPHGVYASSMIADLSAAQIVEESMIFPSIRIRAGRTLIVDGPGYNITLGTANALAAYQGEWLDIDRNFVGLDVESPTSGNFEVTVRYQEMFL